MIFHWKSITFFGLPEINLSPAGKLCSDASLQPISDKKECRQSFQALKKLYPEAIDGVSYQHTWPQRPKGCFVHLQNNNLHWNTHETGSPNPYDRQVCKDLSTEEGSIVNNNIKITLKPI